MSKVTVVIITLMLAIVGSFCKAENLSENTESLAKTVCGACHGSDGNSALSMNPIIAQQHSDYIYKQLMNFQSGKRQNAIMMGIASGLSEKNISELSIYFSAFKAKTVGVQNISLAEVGEKIYRVGIRDRKIPACGSCHLPNGAGIPGQFPRLAGQYSQYTANQLNYFKSGARKNDKGAVMRTIASRMTEKEIGAVAEYISGLN